MPAQELVMVQREAAFLISCATEQLIHRLAEAAQRVAERDRRTTVQAKDLGESSHRSSIAQAIPETTPLPQLPPCDEQTSLPSSKVCVFTSAAVARRAECHQNYYPIWSLSRAHKHQAVGNLAQSRTEGREQIPY